MKTITKVIISIIVIAAVLIGLFFYFTRPVAQPTGEIESAGGVTADASEKKLSIVPAESSATFTLHEELRGVKTKVVGTTDQIAGDIAIRTDAPAKLSIGTIKVDARTLKTGNEKRDGAIGRFILKTEDPGNEFLTFAPTSVSGLPGIIPTLTTGLPGNIPEEATFPFIIDGNLTIKGVTKPAQFVGTGTYQDGVLTAKAGTVITYADYGVSVPDLDFLANVEKAVNVTISIVAR